MTFNLLWTDIENKILEKKNLKKEKKKRESVVNSLFKKWSLAVSFLCFHTEPR